jgi:DNA-3-methyladenine glycosylase
MSHPLPRKFYNRSTLTVARELIGARLVRILDGVKLVGLITETEGYIGEEDLACHARAGWTPRTLPMYGPPGHAYVYFTYGNHWMLNAVTEREGFPAAVLIRAIWPHRGRGRHVRATQGTRHVRAWETLSGAGDRQGGE